MNIPAERPQLDAVVADDDAITRRLLKVLLEREGYRVWAADNGQGALNLIRDKQPNVIFLDASMPSPDGFAVCRIVRSELPVDRQPLVVMITAGGQEADREKAMEVGVDHFLTKPFSPSQVSDHLLRLEPRAFEPPS